MLINKSQNLSSLEQAIVSTCLYFDIFDYPLTLVELWKWLYVNFQFSISNFQLKGAKISDIQEVLENSENLKKVIESKNGFYFLKGKENFVDLRFQKYKFAQLRWKKLKRIVTLLQAIPNVMMIAACNMMAINDIKPESDIDVFIIIKKNRIWLTRFLITLLVRAVGQWRHKKRIAGKICLSFYITDDALNLQSIAKKPYDIYLTYWVTLIVPLYKNQNFNSKFKNNKIQKDIYQEFLKANFWVNEYLPNFISFEPVKFERKVSENKFFNLIKIIGERISDSRIGDWSEKLFKKIQKQKMEKNYQSAYYKKDLSVIISDQMLKFHELDRRILVRNLFEKKMAEISQKI
jgi:hypothetical protein